MRKIIPFIALLLAFPILSLAEDRKQTTAQSGPMILIPAGSFIMGSDGALKHEAPRRKVRLPAFYIDKYEVTNAQYKVFLEWVKKNSDKSVKHPDQPLNKNHTPRYWKPFRPVLFKKTGMSKLQKFNEAQFRKPDHPVVGIDWRDAYAYAKWAGKRLPSEAEWEKAARGPDGRRWPWGNKWDFKKCNSGGYEWKGERDGYIYSAPATGYPEGASYYGCRNMAGNVWEWTADSPKNEPDKKIIKGGGSNSYPSWVRPAARKFYEVEYKYFSLGFRCAKDAK